MMPLVFIAYADNWAQVPALTPRRMGHKTIEGAIRDAVRVIKMGGNNADDTVRVYRRPTTKRWLRREEALASVRRAGRRVHVQLHQQPMH